uniref:Uncharacterized protein n=1 Tax=Arcella intermedia TaxID=1963864 RepID=A0A6B2LW10_9EUKA
MDNTIKIWDIECGRELSKFEGHKDCVNSGTIDEDKIVSGSADGTIRTWDTISGKEVSQISLGGDIKTVTVAEGIITIGSIEGCYYVI